MVYLLLGFIVECVPAKTVAYILTSDPRPNWVSFIPVWHNWDKSYPGIDCIAYYQCNIALQDAGNEKC